MFVYTRYIIYWQGLACFKNLETILVIRNEHLSFCIFILLYSKCFFKDQIIQEEADIAFQARIQRPVAWLGPFKVGQISVVVLKSSNTGNNVLRTKLAIGGADARFTANSFINKFLNAAVVPLVRSHFYDESFAEDIYQHLVEESYLSAQIMQYLYDE